MEACLFRRRLRPQGEPGTARRAVTDPHEAEGRQRRLTRAQLIRKVCGIDPMLCPCCGATMRFAVPPAGEASTDSQGLVAEHLATDPVLAAQVEAARGLQLRLPPPRPLPPEAERQALAETRSLLKQRTSTIAMAVLFTLLPFAFVFDEGGVRFLLLEDEPVIAAAWWATAAALWLWHLRRRRTLKKRH